MAVVYVVFRWMAI
uniref:Uncharacterized protein n=1 Tax=Anguilla anguilla TaxID=7936 RepID=A0A0E9Q7B8_ANGAN